MAPAPMEVPAPIVTQGPISAEGSTLASGDTIAVEWIPGVRLGWREQEPESLGEMGSRLRRYDNRLARRRHVRG